MDGKKIIIAMLVAVVIIGLISYGLYLLTRQDEVESGNEPLTPNAFVVRYEPAALRV
jgi:hypothetical protein